VHACRRFHNLIGLSMLSCHSIVLGLDFFLLASAWMVYADNEVDGPTLLKLSEGMISRLLPTMKLQVKFIALQKSLLAGHAEQHVMELHDVEQATPSQPLDTTTCLPDASGQPG